MSRVNISRSAWRENADGDVANNILGGVSFFVEFEGIPVDTLCLVGEGWIFLIALSDISMNGRSSIEIHSHRPVPSSLLRNPGPFSFRGIELLKLIKWSQEARGNFFRRKNHYHDSNKIGRAHV